jgi:hypothetical protein
MTHNIRLSTNEKELFITYTEDKNTHKNDAHMYTCTINEDDYWVSTYLSRNVKQLYNILNDNSISFAYNDVDSTYSLKINEKLEPSYVLLAFNSDNSIKLFETITTIENECNELKRKLKELKTEHDELNLTNNQLSEDNLQLQESVENEKNKHNDLKLENNKLKDEVNNLVRMNTINTHRQPRATQGTSMGGFSFGGSQIPSAQSAGVFGQPSAQSAGAFGEPSAQSARAFGEPSLQSTGVFGEPSLQYTRAFRQPPSQATTFTNNP